MSDKNFFADTKTTIQITLGVVSLLKISAHFNLMTWLFKFIGDQQNADLFCLTLQYLHLQFQIKLNSPNIMIHCVCFKRISILHRWL